MITDIDIDEALVTEAMRLTGSRSKQEVVNRALRELVSRASRPSVRQIFGIGGVEPNYDPKATCFVAARAGGSRVEGAIARGNIEGLRKP